MAAGDPGSPARYYSSTAVETSLQSSIPAQSQGQQNTSFIVGSISGFPTSYPYTLIIDPDTSKEEVLTVTAGSGTTLTVTRGSDGTQAVAHSAGAVVRHGVSGRDFREAENHIAARGYDTDESILSAANQTHVHGLAVSDGVVVGTTKAQTISNKVFIASTLAGAITSSATVTVTGAIVVSGGSITGLPTPATTSAATPKGYVDSILGDATAASTSAAAAHTSAVAASTSAANASASASAASTSAAAANTSAIAASTSAVSAETYYQATLVAANSVNVNAALAQSSAVSASSSAANASISQASANTSAVNASTSEANASAFSASASTSAAGAATSATSANLSYQSTVGQAGTGLVRDMGLITSADTSTGPYVSISTLTDNATAAASSAVAASTSSVIAATTATAAATSASASAVAASTSAASASVSAAAASTSAASAAASATQAASAIPAVTSSVSGYFLSNNGTSALWVSLSDWGSIV
jgi:hypothetical protein